MKKEGTYNEKEIKKITILGITEQQQMWQQHFVKSDIKFRKGEELSRNSFPEKNIEVQDDNCISRCQCFLATVCIAEAFATFSFLDMLNKASIQFTHYSLWLLQATRAIKERLQPQTFNVQMYLVECVVSLIS